MSKTETIKKNEDFQKIFEKGHSISGRYIVVYFLHNEFKINRFGFCVGKKVGSAVIRNRLKRVLREAVSFINHDKTHDSFDILLVARNRLINADFNSIIAEIQHILDTAERKGLI